MDAAQIYREWFKAEKAVSFTPIKESDKLPDWYKESPVVVTYPVRGTHDTDVMNPNKMFPYINAMPHIERLEKELGSKLLVLLMHWEGTAPWAPPYVWPPFGGEDELRKFVEALHKRGDVIGLYCSGIGWTLKSKVADYDMTKVFEKNNLRDEMCLSPEQELPYSKICTAQRTGYDLCPSRSFTVNAVLEEVKKMTACGVDYIQLLDQNHGGTSYFCYSKNHSHPPVPGKWQVDAMKGLMSEISKDAGRVLFGCESAAAEAYIPYLKFSDNRFNLNYNAGRPVPVYSYIFHEYLNNFMGNQVSTDYWLDSAKSPENILERIAYAFCAGDMLTLVLNENGEITQNWAEKECGNLPEQTSVKTLIKNANAWRQRAPELLHSGKMVRGFKTECEQNKIYTTRGTYIPCDAVYSSAWQDESGDYGQFLVNYNTSVAECSVTLPNENYILKTIDGECKTLKQGTTELEIPPLSIILIKNK